MPEPAPLEGGRVNALIQAIKLLVDAQRRLLKDPSQISVLNGLDNIRVGWAVRSNYDGAGHVGEEFRIRVFGKNPTLADDVDSAAYTSAMGEVNVERADGTPPKETEGSLHAKTRFLLRLWKAPREYFSGDA
jgi:hypothetical protein